MEHFFRYHKAQNLRFTSCPFQPLLPITNVEEAKNSIWYQMWYQISDLEIDGGKLLA
jgi:hypothetical protein